MRSLPGRNARTGDMHPTRVLQINIQPESGDIVITIEQEGFPVGYHQQKGDVPWGDRHVASVEFCTVGSGGGRSPKTYRALKALIEAIKEDNAERPM